MSDTAIPTSLTDAMAERWRLMNAAEQAYEVLVEEGAIDYLSGGRAFELALRAGERTVAHEVNTFGLATGQGYSDDALPDDAKGFVRGAVTAALGASKARILAQRGLSGIRGRIGKKR